MTAFDVPDNPTRHDADPRPFLYGLASVLLVTRAGGVPPALALPPRPHSPTARRAQMETTITAFTAELDRQLGAKKLPPSGTPLSTRGRRLVSNGELYDEAAGTYTPGPGLAALVAGLVEEAANEKGR